MRASIGILTALMVAFVLGRLSAQDVEPSCHMCPTTYVSSEEIQRYADLGRDVTTPKTFAMVLSPNSRREMSS